MPRTWRAGGIIGPTTAKQNAGAGGVEVWSLERYELEKQKKLLIKLPEELKSLERYVLEKLEKFFVKVLEAEEIADKAAGGDGAVLNRARGARKAEEIADNFTEGDEFPEENAAVLERLEKKGAKFFI